MYGILFLALVNIIVLYCISTSTINNLQTAVYTISQASKFSCKSWCSLQSASTTLELTRLTFYPRQLQIAHDYGYAPFAPSVALPVLGNSIDQTRKYLDLTLASSNSQKERSLWSAQDNQIKYYQKYLH